MVQTGGVIHGNEQAIRGWLDRCLAGDLFVTSGGPLSTPARPSRCGRTWSSRSSGRSPAPGLSRCGSATWPGVGAKTPTPTAAATRLASCSSGHGCDALCRHEPGPEPPLPDLAVSRRLAEPGTVLVSENFAALHGVVIGDTIALEGVEGPVTLRVVGTVVDYSCGRGTVMVDRARYGRLFDAEGVQRLSVALPASADAESIGRRIQQGPRAAELALRPASAALRRHILGMVRRLYGVAYVQRSSSRRRWPRGWRRP